MKDDNTTNRALAQPDVVCLTCPARNSLFCSGLDDHELTHLNARATRMTLSKGQSLILEGDSSKAVYNIIDGDVVLSRLSDDGRRQIFGFLGSGDFIGLTLSGQYRFSADALTKTRLCRFDRQAMEGLMERFPGMDQQIRRMGSATIDHMMDMTFSLGRKTARERVAGFLVDLAKKQTCCQQSPIIVHLVMTRADIADYLGLTLETVSRVLSQLKKQKTIHLHPAGRIEISNLAELAAIADMEPHQVTASI